MQLKYILILCVINIINVKSNIKNASLTIQSLDEINKSKKGAICYGLIPPSTFLLSMIIMKILKEHSTKSDFVISSLTMIFLIGGDGVIKLFLNYFGLSLFF